MMKIAVISIVKNEADIIELFVKINARICDHMYIVDGSSDDGTFEILKQLEKTYKLTVLVENGLHYFQDQLMTQLVNEIAASNEYDFIVLLDADEFISKPREYIEEVLTAVDPAKTVGLVAWKTYVPLNANWDDLDSTLYESFVMRSREPLPNYKLILPCEIAKTCAIKEGNHDLLGSSDLKRVVLPLSIQHVPVRSSRQIVQKTILISHRQSIKPKLESPIEGFHVTLMAKRIRELDYKIDEESLKSIAMNYCSFKQDQINDFNYDIKIGHPADRIELKTLRRDNTIKAFDQFLLKLCAEYNKFIYNR